MGLAASVVVFGLLAALSLAVLVVFAYRAWRGKTALNLSKLDDMEISPRAVIGDTNGYILGRK